MSSSLRLLNLPHVVQKHVFHQLNVLEVFNLSLTSARMRNALKLSSLRAIEHHVSFEGYTPILYTVFKEENGLNDNSLFWQFTDEAKMENRETKPMKIGCHLFEKSFIDDYTVFTTYHNWEFGMYVAFQYIFDILPGPVDVLIDLGCVRNLHAILLNFTNCRKLHVKEGYNAKTFDHDFYDILDSANVQTELEAHLSQRSDADIDQIKHLKNVSLLTANWITLPDLLSLKCENGSIMNHKLTESDLNAFAENWYNSTDRTLEMIQFGWDENKPFIPKSKTLKWKRFNPKVRSRCFWMKTEYKSEHQIDCSAGFDITRPDGLTATFYFEDHFHCTVTFFVWHDPHPQTACMKELRGLLEQQYINFHNVERTLNSSKDDRKIARYTKKIIYEPSVNIHSYIAVKQKSVFKRTPCFELYDCIIFNIFDLQSKIASWKCVR